MPSKTHQFEIWCQLMLSKTSERVIHSFFKKKFYIDSKFLIHNMHITVYHSRRPMFILEENEINCHLIIDTEKTRFMVLAPGGENPRPDLIPADRKIGIRIKKGSQLRMQIDNYRELATSREDKKTLGSRKPSTRARSAFGSQHFQPHLSILKSGSGIKTDLTEVGSEFREIVQELIFDKYIISRKQFY